MTPPSPASPTGLPADPLQALLALSGAADPYPPTSRYHGVGAAAIETPDGRTITYTRRRLIPQPERYATLHEHTAVQGDRLDNLAARYLGDPEAFWRLCDANAATRPSDLTDTPGAAIRITLPDGIPANPASA